MTGTTPPRFPSACRQFVTAMADALDRSEAPRHPASCPRCARLWQAARLQARVLRGLDRPELPAAATAPGFLTEVYARAAAQSEARFGDTLRAGLAPVEAPADAPGLLAEVYARAAARSEARVGDALRAGLAPVEAPAGAPGLLAEVYARAAAKSEARFGDALRAGLAPVEAPADAVWVDDGERRDLSHSLQRALPERRSPGWMWKRIRHRIERDTTAPSTAPRHATLRWGLAAAAGLLLSGLAAYHGVRGLTGDSGLPLIPVVFEEASAPLDASFSMDGFLQVGR